MMVTFNMGNAQAENLQCLFDNPKAFRDIIVIGLQESTFSHDETPKAGSTTTSNPFSLFFPEQTPSTPKSAAKRPISHQASAKR